MKTGASISITENTGRCANEHQKFRAALRSIVTVLSCTFTLLSSSGLRKKGDLKHLYYHDFYGFLSDFTGVC